MLLLFYCSNPGSAWKKQDILNRCKLLLTGTAQSILMTILSLHSPSSPSGQGLSSEELQNYLGSGVVVFNLHTKQLVFSSILEVSRVNIFLPLTVIQCRVQCTQLGHQASQACILYVRSGVPVGSMVG